MTRKSQEPEGLVRCTCPSGPGDGRPCQVPHDRFLVANVPADQPYPCRCEGWRPCDPNWCECAGRTDLENLPSTCCARTPNGTPRAAAKAKHGGTYRPCWCNGDLDRHKTQTKLPAVGLIDPDAEPDEDEEDE